MRLLIQIPIHPSQVRPVYFEFKYQISLAVVDQLLNPEELQDVRDVKLLADLGQKPEKDQHVILLLKVSSPGQEDNLYCCWRD